MGLLIELPYAGASSDYLYARIRCRRSELATVGLPQDSASDWPQQKLLAEYRWLYRQAGPQLRKKLLPIFEYFELRLLVVALRCLAVGARSALRSQLQQSLFQTKVIEIIESSEQVADALERLQLDFAAQYLFCGGLMETYLRQGPGGLEQVIVGGYLRQAVQDCRSEPVKRFLRYLLDMRNLLALQKHLYWQVPVDPPLLPSGSIDMTVLEKIWNDRDVAGLRVLMQQVSGQQELPGEIGCEGYLLQGLTSRLQREGRDPLQLGVVIDYLWRCWLATREQGLRLHRDGQIAERPLAEVSG